MNEEIDSLIHTYVFSVAQTKSDASQKIKTLASECGIYSASHHNVYNAFATGLLSGFTIPAINIRTLTYDTATTIFSYLKKIQGICVFEIALSEQSYSLQDPDEYFHCIIAGAIKAGYSGPVFIQADHYQLDGKKYATNSVMEVERIQAAIKSALDAGYKNIDIDASTLVDLTAGNIDSQQKDNYTVTAQLAQFIRATTATIEGTISIGGEIGHIGGVNSTPEDFTTFMDGFLSIFGKDKPGLSKIAIQSGTSHGGTPLPDGHISKATVDFELIKTISELARSRYQMSGAVQHGASTLDTTEFSHFPDYQTVEIHLATGIQNIVFDTMPKNLLDEMSAWVESNCQNEKKPDWNDTQFLYKTRKKALGKFKKNLWELPNDDKHKIMQAIETYIAQVFSALRIQDSFNKIKSYI